MNNANTTPPIDSDDKPASAPNEVSSSEQQQAPKLSALHVLTSVFAAAIGVQSKKNQEKDFSSKQSIYIYITAGILFTVAFVFTVIFVVKTVLSSAGM
jgi:hypothetical protein